MIGARLCLWIADGVLAVSFTPGQSAFGALLGGSAGPAHTLRLSFQAGALEDAVVQGLAQVRQLPTWPTARVAVHAWLGMAASRIGLIRIAPGSGARARLDGAQVQGWIGHHWRIDSSAQIVRWANVGFEGCALVSCVDVASHQAVFTACQRSGLRLASCEPALLALGSPVSVLHGRQDKRAEHSDSVLVCTEDAAQGLRSSSVQLVHVRAGRPAASWRGWIPPAIADGVDIALQGAAQRFIHAKDIRQDAPIHALHWQLSAAAQQPALRQKRA